MCQPSTQHNIIIIVYKGMSAQTKPQYGISFDVKMWKIHKSSN